MPLVSTTTRFKLFCAVLFTGGFFIVKAQENSPYSRYGLGDVMPSQSILNRGMGGIAAGYVDYDKRYDLKSGYPKSQTINFLNPAGYSKLRITSFDLGFESGTRTLSELNNAKKYKASSAIVSYVQLGIPLSRKQDLGMNIGLRPITRINYKIQKDERVSYPISGLSDSIRNLFEGSGGAYQVFAGFGKGFKNVSIGFNIGYLFGTSDYSTRKIFINDSVFPYYRSNYQTKTSFGGLALEGGIQYRAALDKRTVLILGAHASNGKRLNGNEDIILETFEVTAGGSERVESILITTNNKGKINYPGTLGVGFTINREDRWLFGMDFTSTAWKNYSFYGKPDLVRDSWQLKAGLQLNPDLLRAKNYWGRVFYRLGFNYGVDYVKLNTQDVNLLNFTGGVGLPVKTNRFSNQYTHINLSFEYGTRGNSKTPIKENIFRVGLGLSLGDIWFIKRKYD